MNATFTLSDSLLYLSASADGSTRTDVFADFAGYSDWRLPTIIDLQTILDANAAGCGSSGNPCIDPIFGPTVAGFYWSATTIPSNLAYAWVVNFNGGTFGVVDKGNVEEVRAVRAGL